MALVFCGSRGQLYLLEWASICTVAVERISGHRGSIVAGAAAAGGTLCFGLAGLEDQIVIEPGPAQARVTGEINNFVVTGQNLGDRG